MRVLNQTRFVHQFTMGMDKSGREYLSFVVKGTFAFPDSPSERPRPAPAQRPLVMADEYFGEPGFSAPLWESDFAFRKSRCDVVLQGAAYAPGGKPAERVRVGLKVGQWSKQFDVVGPREWRVIGPAITATRPYPFARQVFSYGTAFGGPDRTDPEDKAPPAYARNPVGMGFAGVRSQSRLSGQPLPNTEKVDQPVTSPYGDYRPMALGPIGRGWPERIRYGGTYDRNWIDNVFPFLPADFDDRYFQMAPEDQQIDFPEGGTPVTLVNLTHTGREAFRLPDTALPIRIFRGRDICFDAAPRPDTLIFDPEARVFMMVWRVWVPMQRIITEFTEGWLGAPTPAMKRAFATGKRYIRSFAEEPA
ncbi:DUF2169 family type VI secretion system accessory protein [Paracoccus marinaquae]|uniref:DUF2169 domain-containing protein n=1 Tax=Paracoccus marinaquae TaxID=2841926 RepID=A0ABS6AMS6_9RHOB|nr:DUF2169 domain-containing protein [Paracoccus marinaquae]MBU3031496.1 DUF2169 domain-containing protein [Paracoccus marinaquae]